MSPEVKIEFISPEYHNQFHYESTVYYSSGRDHRRDIHFGVGVYRNEVQI